MIKRGVVFRVLHNASEAWRIQALTSKVSGFTGRTWIIPVEKMIKTDHLTIA
jgi:hypothetical protein